MRWHTMSRAAGRVARTYTAVYAAATTQGPKQAKTPQQVACCGSQEIIRDLLVIINKVASGYELIEHTEIFFSVVPSCGAMSNVDQPGEVGARPATYLATKAQKLGRPNKSDFNNNKDSGVTLGGFLRTSHTFS